MFFILSKVLLILIQPICWIFYLFVIAAMVKNIKLKKRLFFTALGLLYFFSNAYIFNLVASRWDVTQMPPHNTKYSCAIVLGGFSSVDDDGNGYFNGSSDRFIEAIKLKAEGRVLKIMISGGSGLLLKGHDFREADFVLTQLQALHVPDSSILIEDRSRNTLENAVFSKRILKADHVQGPYLLVTSAFHMRRALLTFKKAGIAVVPYPCDFIAGKITDINLIGIFIPDADSLTHWNLYIKEFVGYVAYSFKRFPQN